MSTKIEATIEDLYRVPEHGKAEIVNGELVLMSPTGGVPGRASGEIYISLHNYVCMEVKKQKVLLYLKLKPKEISNPPTISRDVSSIGHFGTGDFEITVTSPADLAVAKEFIDIAYQRIGG